MGLRPTWVQIPLPAPIRNSHRIVEYVLNRKKQGFAELTLRSDSKILRFLAPKCDLNNPDTVLQFLADYSASHGRKQNIANCYSLYAQYCKLPFSKPHYPREDKLPFIPTDAEIEALINNAKTIRHAATLRLLKETGMRIGEACRLLFKDFDFERRTVRVIPEKNGRARELKLSEKLVAILQHMFAKKQHFPSTDAVRDFLEDHRKVLAEAQNNPRFLQIHLHTFRHFKATMTYFQTKDLLHVQKILGHKSIQHTIRYTQLIDFQEENSFVCKTAKSISEATPLVEAGFEYVTELDSVKLFRKRK